MSNLLPLESFRIILGYHPYHWNGLANTDQVPLRSDCNSIVTKYDWQNAMAVGRESMIGAIEQAEARLLKELDYSVAPHYATETIPYPAYENPSLWRHSPIDATGRWLSVTLNERKVIAIGVERLTAIQTAVALTYSAQTGSGLNDTFTLTTASTTTQTDPDKIAVYFSAADRLDSDGVGDTWRILPVKVTINANGTVTITGRSWMLVRPILYEGVGNADGMFGAIDPATAGNFATTLDVYERTTDPNGLTLADAQGALYWETLPYPSWGGCCGGSGSFTPGGYTDPASYLAAPARVGIRDAELGIVFPGEAVYNATDGTWASVLWGTCSPPDRVTVRFLAGEALVNGQMRSDFAKAVARLAMAELPNRIAACDAANRELFRWQFDRARAGGSNDEQYSISPEDLDCPFGTREGQIYAWHFVNEQRLLRGFAV